jgi:hypothetical protein
MAWLNHQADTNQPRSRAHAQQHGLPTRRAHWRCCLPCPASTGPSAAPAGLDTVGGTIEELGRAHDPRGVALGAVAGILKVAGGLLALALVRPWGRAVPRRLLLGAAWTASVVLTGYGGLLVAVGALVLTGVVSPAGPVDRTALRWHVLVWDLWFLVWGLLLGVAAWRLPVLRQVWSRDVNSF